MSKTGEQERRRDAFVAGVLHGENRGVGAALLRGLLTPPALLHRMGLEVYLTPFRIGLRQRYRIEGVRGEPVPTIAIGNLTSGGTGKTPMAQLVAGYLQRTGNRVVLLSRGHGGEEKDRARVVGDGFRTLLTADQAGDEPVLLADSLPGVPVVIDKDRRRGSRLAVERFATDVVVLDDALQYWQLERDLDIVLLDARHPFDNGYLLPRGLLREPPSHLSRAGIVVLTRADRIASADDLQRTHDRVSRLAPNAEVFTATHAPVGWVQAGDSGNLLPLDALAGRRVSLFSAIADNDAFRRSVEALGVTVADAQAFPDHHAYNRADLDRLTESAELCEAAVTTEKDMVKVNGRWQRRSGVPVYALRIALRLDDEKRFFRALKSVLETDR